MIFKESCAYYKDKQECYEGMKANNGTVAKLNAIENYVKAWTQIMIRQNKIDYRGLVFIDAMCSTGRYYNETSKKVIPGTSVRVYREFYARAKEFSNFDFYLFLNDYNEQSIECQKKCNSLKELSNLHIDYNIDDVSDYLEKISHFFKKHKHLHAIIFYDPFIADIRWDKLSLLSKSLSYHNFKKFDLMITHFHPSDPLRVMHKIINKEKLSQKVIKRYETTYDLSLEDIRSAMLKLKNSKDRSIWFRNRLVEVMSLYLGVRITDVAYAPIFNSKNSTIYDFVFYSPSSKAKHKFKSNIRKTVLDSSDYKNYDINQISFLERLPNKEIELFYDTYYQCQIIAKNFKGKTEVKYSEIESFVNKHPYISMDKRRIIDGLYKHFNVLSNNKGARDKRLYDFSVLEGGL